MGHFPEALSNSLQRKWGVRSGVLKRITLISRTMVFFLKRAVGPGVPACLHSRLASGPFKGGKDNHYPLLGPSIP